MSYDLESIIADTVPERPWPDVANLPPELPRAPGMSTDMLPPGLDSWILDLADRTRWPLECVAFPAVAATMGMVGRAVSLRNGSGRHKFWPVMWTAIVGGSGTMKTATLKNCLAYLLGAEQDAKAQYSRHAMQTETEIQLLEVEIQKAIKPGKGKKGDPAEINRLKEKLKHLKALRPARYVIRDGTPEAIGELFAAFPVGLLLFRDELNPTLANAEHPDADMLRGLFNSAWDGDSGYSNDRIGRGHVDMPVTSLSVVGGIQPGPLAARFERLRQDQGMADGLLQRFVFIWPDRLPQVDRLGTESDPRADEQATRVFQALERMRHRYPTTATLSFSPDAQADWDGYSLEKINLARGQDVEKLTHFSGWAGKVRSLIAGLALMFRVYRAIADGESLEQVAVEQQDLELALRWGVLAEGHANKVYAWETNRPVYIARKLADGIQSGRVPHNISLRDLRHSWPSVGDLESVRTALSILEGLGWCRLSECYTGRRPSEVIELHPSLR